MVGRNKHRASFVRFDGLDRDVPVRLWRTLDYVAPNSPGRSGKSSEASAPFAEPLRSVRSGETGIRGLRSTWESLCRHRLKSRTDEFDKHPSAVRLAKLPMAALAVSATEAMRNSSYGYLLLDEWWAIGRRYLITPGE